MWVIDVCGLEEWNETRTANGSYFVKPRSGRGGIAEMIRGAGRRFGFGGGRSLAAGTYRVELDVDGKKTSQPLVIVR